MAAWGNALGGYRRQKRIAGRFAGGGVNGQIKRVIAADKAQEHNRNKRIDKSFDALGASLAKAGPPRTGHIGGGVVAIQPQPGSQNQRKKVAKARYKATKKRNNAGYKNRVKGSVKARKNELRTNKAVRARNVTGGAGKVAAGVVLNSEHMTNAGYKQLKQGVKGNVGRVKSTKAWSKGLKKSQNKKAKQAYRKEAGINVKARRAAAVGVMAASTIGAVAVANKRGNLSQYATKIPLGMDGSNSMYTTGFAAGRKGQAKKFGASVNVSRSGVGGVVRTQNSTRSRQFAFN